MTYYFYSYAFMIQPVASVSAQASLCRLGLPGCALVLGAWHPTGYCGCYWDWPPCRQQQRAAGGGRSGVWWLRIIPAEPVLFGLQPFARETAVLVGGYKSDVLTYGNDDLKWCMFFKSVETTNQVYQVYFFVQTKRDDWGINNGCVRQVGVPLRHWRGS